MTPNAMDVSPACPYTGTWPPQPCGRGMERQAGKPHAARRTGTRGRTGGSGRSPSAGADARGRRGKGSQCRRRPTWAPSISRRAFVALTGLAGAGMALTGCAPKASEGDAAADAQPESVRIRLRYGRAGRGCHVNCGSRCPLKVYVKDGTVVRIGNDNDGTDDFGPTQIYQMRSCVRGRTNRQRIYNDTRVQKPLKRVRGHQARRRQVRGDQLGRGHRSHRRHHEGDQGPVRQRRLLHPVRHGHARRHGVQVVASRQHACSPAS